MPVRVYGVADGLAHGRVNAILEDARGYLWVATWEGLSRFDGARFASFGTREGLEHPLLFSMVEDRFHHLWSAEWGTGVVRLVEDPSARKSDAARFVPADFVPPLVRAEVGDLAVDGDGALWALVDDALYEGTPDATGRVSLVRVPETNSAPQALVAAKDGQIWIAREGHLERREGGAFRRVVLPEPLAPEEILHLAAGPAGEILAVRRTRVDVCTFTPAAVRCESVRTGLVPGAVTRTALAARDGTVWIGTSAGLLRARRSQGGWSTTRFGRDAGLSDDWVRALYEDRDGNIWIGTQSGGIDRLDRSGWTALTTAEGLPGQNTLLLVRSKEGRLFASSEQAGLSEIAGGRARPVSGSGSPPFSNAAVRIAVDAAGDFWVGTDVGLYRVPGPYPDYARAVKVGGGAGVPEGYIVAVAADKERSRIWLSTENGLVLWAEPRGRAIPRFEKLAIDSSALAGIRTFQTDRTGIVWLGAFRGLARLRAGHMESIALSASPLDTQTRTSLEDSRGRLWFGLRDRGISMTEEPAAERPAFRTFTLDDGLASNTVWSLAEGPDGRLLAGTGKGLDRLDPATWRFEHLGREVGLIGQTVNHVLVDAEGTVWAATAAGVARFERGMDTTPAPPTATLLTGVRLGGERLPLPDGGTPVVEAREIPPGPNHLILEWVAPSTGGADSPRYQFRLEGADREWSPPTEETTISYANLAPGSYRFLVRAARANGIEASAATFPFTVLPPLRDRAWFRILVALGLAGLAFTGHRRRVARLLAVERMRSQIALDLHDDVGAGLSQIAILSEVAKRDASATSTPLLNEIGTSARQLRESMADIVWSVDPRHDRLHDVVKRLREVAWSTLEVAGVVVTFDAPEAGASADLPLRPDQRRHVLLILKEAVANIARHASAAHVAIEIARKAGHVVLTVRDDGRGFDPQRVKEGNGLLNLRRRSEALGAQLDLRSGPGRGTTVVLTLP